MIYNFSLRFCQILALKTIDLNRELYNMQNVYQYFCNISLYTNVYALKVIFSYLSILLLHMSFYINNMAIDGHHYETTTISHDLRLKNYIKVIVHVSLSYLSVCLSLFFCVCLVASWFFCNKYFDKLFIYIYIYIYMYIYIGKVVFAIQFSMVNHLFLI